MLRATYRRATKPPSRVRRAEPSTIRPGCGLLITLDLDEAVNLAGALLNVAPTQE